MSGASGDASGGAFSDVSGVRPGATARPRVRPGAPPRVQPGPPPPVRPVVRRVGRRALLVELPDAAATESFHAEVLRLRDEGELPGGVREIVPGARTVLLDGLARPARVAAELTALGAPPSPADRADGPTLDIPVRYDGPDLAEVAELWGVPPGDVGRLHSATAFRVAFCGFAPGFGYLTGLPEHRHVPRRAAPRTRVPAGAVALAGPYTGVYPRPSPGGWQIIGTAVDTVLWDPARDPAALLSPGTRVRFVPVPVPGAGAGAKSERKGVRGPDPHVVREAELVRDTEPEAVREAEPENGS